jgi:hypothetical protein
MPGAGGCGFADAMLGQAGRQRQVEGGRGMQIMCSSSSSSSNRLVHDLEADGGRGSEVSNDQGQDKGKGLQTTVQTTVLYVR